MYNAHPNVLLQNSRKNLSCIIHIDFLEFVAAKFNVNLIFIPLFIWLVLSKNKNEKKKNFSTRNLHIIETKGKRSLHWNQTTFGLVWFGFMAYQPFLVI